MIAKLSINWMEARKEPEFIIRDPERQEENRKPTPASFKEVYQDEFDFPFSNFSKEEKVTLGKYDPSKEHLVVIPGINFKGKCQNQKCPAFKSKVSWIRKGYGTFSINEERFNNKCRGCGEKIKGQSIVSLGYTEAILQINGLKIEGENEVEVNLNFSCKQKGQFCYFTDIDENICKWGYLRIDVKRP